MAKISFSGTSLSNNVVPAIQSTITALDRVIAINNSMSVPAGFSHASMLNEYRNTISNVQSSFRDIQNWVVRSNKALETTIAKMNTEVASVRTEEIMERGNAVS